METGLEAVRDFPVASWPPGQNPFLTPSGRELQAELCLRVSTHLWVNHGGQGTRDCSLGGVPSPAIREVDSRCRCRGGDANELKMTAGTWGTRLIEAFASMKLQTGSWGLEILTQRGSCDASTAEARPEQNPVPLYL